jgi:hypothetical protein
VADIAAPIVRSPLLKDSSTLNAALMTETSVSMSASRASRTMTGLDTLRF